MSPVSRLFVLTITAGALPAQVSAGDDILFNRDIRPLLSDYCFACHGPDEHERKAKLRLDIRDGGAFEDRDGVTSIIPGKPDESELVYRITTEDKDELMPPPEGGKELKPHEIELLKKWIAGGAEYEGHWAFNPPTKPAVPEGVNVIDHFIGERLKREGLKPAPPAEAHTLLRRLSFDLNGLPPNPAEVEEFAAAYKADPEAAVAATVKRLVASPRYGEHMATFWLDLVRYADSIGYHSDASMDVYLYREWVINALNANMPFDQFTVEQIAGDLLDNPTRGQRIASTYNNLLQTTEEGGAQLKEYLAIYAADRVRNVSSAWLGGTMACAQCHDHKFDPFTTRDFYSMAAFFADVKDPPVSRHPAAPAVPTREQEEARKKLADKLAALEAKASKATPELAAAQKEWEKTAASAKPAPPKNIAAILKLAPDKRNEKQAAELAKHYLSIAPALADARKRRDAAKKELAALDKQIPRSRITVSTKPREMRILPRGNWLDDSGEVVQPAVPEFLGKLEIGETRGTRLDLARWLVTPENPMTARAFVNRLWKLFYGHGLSSNVDDLGSQGSWPSHPELLDWLAVEFIESGWDVKHMVELMLNTRTYIQSSKASPELRERDPMNELLARQSRFRVDAEVVRDNALALGGILVEKIGGPSVKPYQPAGYWRHLNFPKRTYQHDTDENQYRRALYSHWQRSFLHPSLLAFDATSREECTAARPRSNTPLQALVLLNDPTYVEASRAFATRMIKEGGVDPESRIEWAIWTALSREALPAEVKLLADLQTEQLARYKGDEAAAKELNSVGIKPPPADIPPAELASWSAVARTILNLHETITRY